MELYSSEESSDSDNYKSLKTLDFSYKHLDTQSLYICIENLTTSSVKEKKPENISKLNIYQNELTEIPDNISKFCNLRKIDASRNNITRIPEMLTRLPLHTLILNNNNLGNDAFPKSLKSLEHTLEELNLSGNNLTIFPEQILSLVKLKLLSLGQNLIEEIPFTIHRLNRLEILSLGGNALREVPRSLCRLNELKALILSDNQLEYIPVCIANLKLLRTLQLHRNKLKTLPVEIVTLKHLSELNLRENPLINKFICDMTYNPPSLQEASARTIKLHNIPYNLKDIPQTLYNYLQSAHHCVNPKCRGVYFDNRVEHIKFVDFCGKYRVPLLHYLCSSKCIDYSSSDEDSDNSNPSNNLMRKVLLG